MRTDSGIQWIREVRTAISEEFDNDPQRFVAFHKKLNVTDSKEQLAGILIAKEESKDYSK